MVKGGRPGATTPDSAPQYHPHRRYILNHDGTKSTNGLLGVYRDWGYPKRVEEGDEGGLGNLFRHPF